MPRASWASRRGRCARVRRGLMAGLNVNGRLLLIPRHEVEAWRGRGRLRPGPKPARKAARRGEDDIPPLVRRLDATAAAISRGRMFEDSAAVIREAREERAARWP